MVDRLVETDWALRRAVGKRLPSDVQDGMASFRVLNLEIVRYPDNSLEVWLDVAITGRSGSPEHWKVGLPYSPGESWASTPMTPAKRVDASLIIAMELEEWWYTRRTIRSWRVDDNEE